MTKTLMFAICALVSVDTALADAVNDRVLLQPSDVPGCPSGSLAFKRTLQKPDGTQVVEAAEFVVPTGKYLEITSIEYATPRWSGYDSMYSQYVTLSMSRRSSNASTIVFHFSYLNRPIFNMEEDRSMSPTGMYLGVGPDTRVAAFPVGPLMSNAARLCLQAPRSFHDYDGTVRVRGRLIAQDTIVSPIGGGNGSSAP